MGGMIRVGPIDLTLDGRELLVRWQGWAVDSPLPYPIQGVESWYSALGL